MPYGRQKTLWKNYRGVVGDGGANVKPLWADPGSRIHTGMSFALSVVKENCEGLLFALSGRDNVGNCRTQANRD